MCCPVRHPRLPAAIRLNDNGTLDSTFGVGGITTYSLGFDDFAPGSAVFSSNRLLIVGSAFNSGSFNTNTVALTLGGQGTTNLTYSAQWQVLVETPQVAVGGAYTEVTRVWSPLYVDGLVGSDERLATVVDEGFDENGYWATYGYTLTARSYVRVDVNWNVTSLVRANAAVSPVFTTVERYEYDPYGSVTYLSGSFGVLVGGSSYGQKYLHQGGRLDEVTGLYSFRFREYDPVQGRWKQADPAGYVDGGSLYEYVRSDPIGGVDPMGLQSVRGSKPDFPDYLSNTTSIAMAVYAASVAKLNIMKAAMSNLILQENDIKKSIEKACSDIPIAEQRVADAIRRMEERFAELRGYELHPELQDNEEAAQELWDFINRERLNVLANVSREEDLLFDAQCRCEKAKAEARKPLEDLREDMSRVQRQIDDLTKQRDEAFAELTQPKFKSPPINVGR